MEYVSLFLIGLSYGSTACMLSCMPFLTPLLLARGSGAYSGLRTVTYFSLGRIVSYATIAVASGFAATGIRGLLNDAAMSQSLLGTVTFGVGAVVLVRSFRSGRCCTSAPGDAGHAGRFGPFGIGVMMTLNPCVPLLTLVALAAGSRHAADALAMGLAFGIGAVAASWLFFGFILSTVAKEAVGKLAAYQALIERIAAVLLMAVGVSAVYGATQL
jgi:cytochrome c-type biogenesis protein